MKKITVILGIIVFIFLMTCNNSLDTSSNEGRNINNWPYSKLIEGGTIHGTVFINQNEDKTKSTIFLTDFKLTLHEKSTNKEVSNTMTDIFGRYYFPMIAPGTYVLKWERQNGWETGSYPETIIIEDHIFYAQPIEPKPIRGNKVFVGDVRFAREKAAFFNEFFEIQSIPIISFNKSANGQRTDVYSQFAVSSNTNDGTIFLDDNISRRVKLKAGRFESYTFKNNKPLLLGFELTNGQNKIKYPQPRQGINLRALVQDLDGDQLEYTWIINGDREKPLTGNPLKLDMPRGEGTIRAKLLVEDGKGGVLVGEYLVGYGQKEEIFSGIVYERRTDQPLKGAEVIVNNQRVQTNEFGHFRMKVKIAEQYSLSIKKKGFTSYGQAYLQGQTGKSYFIRKLESVSVNTNDEIELKDGDAVLRIPQNSLVDANGNAPNANILGNFTVLDIANNEFPGDFIGRDRERQTSLISFGMAEINFFDEEGNEYNLKKGSKAKIRLPVAVGKNESVIKSAPDKIPIWTYNTSTGEWDRDGMATLNRQSQTYEGTLDHFSTINLDQPGPATCIRVLIDPELLNDYLRVSDVAGDGIDYATVKEAQLDEALSVIYRIPPNQKVKIEVLDSPGGSVNPDVKIDVFDSTQPGLGWVINPNDEVQAGAAISTIWPAYPYEECPLTIHLKHLPVRTLGTNDYNTALAYKGIGSLATANAYYTYMDLGSQRTTLEDWLTHNGYTVTTASSGAVYGNNTSATSSYYNESFLNFNDLGSGRDMHFLLRDDGTASSYVANYADDLKFDQNHDNADRALARDFDAGDVIATVCMEWSPRDNGSNQWIEIVTGIPFNKEVAPYTPAYLQRVRNNSVVKFFVYAQSSVPQTNIPLQIAANLDGYQDKYVPNLCNNCHGGSPSSPDLGAHFRELDYKSYKFDGGRFHPNLLSPERDVFESQNALMLDGNNRTSLPDASAISSVAIKELIDIWYADADNIQQVAIPDDWKKANLLGFNAADHPERLYTNVVGKSCRTCHIAFESPQEFAPDFNHYNEFLLYKGSINNHVNFSSSSNLMPHAVITYRNFWTEPHAEIDENGNEISTNIINKAHYLRQYEDAHWTPPIN